SDFRHIRHLLYNPQHGNEQEKQKRGGRILMEVIAGLILFISFVLLLLLGAPIAVAIILSSLLTFLTVLPFDTAILTAAQRMVTGIDNFTMLAIPLFVLSGIIMNIGGIAFRLVNFAK